jgi:hypothetical protein
LNLNLNIYQKTLEEALSEIERVVVKWKA